MSIRRNSQKNRFARGEWLRWATFRVVEQLSLLRTPDAREAPLLPSTLPDGAALWVFVSTIGELNAVATLMPRLIEAHPDLQLVLISDHEQYREAYLAKYPDAVFFCTQGASSSARLLGGRFTPRLFIIAEIPCIPWDAPCRFTYAMVREARRASALVVLVNGWLYGESPACRMDSLEKSLLTRDYLHAMDIACVQTEDVRNEMIRAGMSPEKLHVTGSMKFDGLQETHWTPAASRSPELLQALIDQGRPIIVIGCMHSPSQQTLVLDAFRRMLDKIPDTLLVFAHRHPEVQQNLDRITADLTSRDIRFELRSRLGTSPPSFATQCLILDTIGELKDFYAIADVTYVCADHSVLEPLTFGKPVTTVSAWRKGLPNYPIYDLLRSSGAIVVADDVTSLEDSWIKWLSDTDSTPQSKPTDIGLARYTGATKLVLEKIHSRTDPEHRKNRNNAQCGG